MLEIHKPKGEIIQSGVQPKIAFGGRGRELFLVVATATRNLVKNSAIGSLLYCYVDSSNLKLQKNPSLLLQLIPQRLEIGFGVSQWLWKCPFWLGTMVVVLVVSCVVTWNNCIGGPQSVPHPRLLVATSLHGTWWCPKLELKIHFSHEKCSPHFSGSNNLPHSVRLAWTASSPIPKLQTSTLKNLLQNFKSPTEPHQCGQSTYEWSFWGVIWCCKYLGVDKNPGLQGILFLRQRPPRKE